MRHLAAWHCCVWVYLNRHMSSSTLASDTCPPLVLVLMKQQLSIAGYSSKRCESLECSSTSEKERILSGIGRPMFSYNTEAALILSVKEADRVSMIFVAP